jgi:hypothetical protein
MVLLHVKQKDDRQFLYESSGKESVDAIVRELVVVNNLQVRILGLKDEGKQLALHGPFKAPRENDEDDSDDDEESANKKPRGPFYCRDPSGHRTGEGTPKNITQCVAKSNFFLQPPNCTQERKLGFGALPCFTIFCIFMFESQSYAKLLFSWQLAIHKYQM